MFAVVQLSLGIYICLKIIPYSACMATYVHTCQDTVIISVSLFKLTLAVTIIGVGPIIQKWLKQHT